MQKVWGLILLISFVAPFVTSNTVWASRPYNISMEYRSQDFCKSLNASAKMQDKFFDKNSDKNLIKRKNKSGRTYYVGLKSGSAYCTYRKGQWRAFLGKRHIAGTFDQRRLCSDLNQIRRNQRKYKIKSNNWTILQPKKKNANQLSIETRNGGIRCIKKSNKWHAYLKHT